MSQAHYRCWSHQGLPSDPCAGAVCRWIMPDGVGVTLCKVSLDYWCDNADEDSDLEPARIEWTWDAGTRTCPIHHWSAVLCEGWTAEHKRLVADLKIST